MLQYPIQKVTPALQPCFQSSTSSKQDNHPPDSISWPKRLFLKRTLVFAAVMPFIDLARNVIQPSIAHSSEGDLKSVFENSSLKPYTQKSVRGPYVYENNQVISVMFATDPSTLRDLVPEPLKVNTEKPTMTFWLSKSNIVKPKSISYHEAAIVAPVSFPRKDQKPIPGFFPIAMYLDSPDSDLLTRGNKIWGFNKYNASVNLIKKQKSITGSVALADTQIAFLKMDMPGKEAELLSFDILPYFNRRYIPGVNKEKDPEIDQLIMVPFRKYRQTKRIIGTGEITMKSTPHSMHPLGEIPITKILGASYSEGNLIFSDGNVLVDYLKQ